MGLNDDYIPRKDVDLANWATSFTTALLPLLERVGIPPATYELLVALKDTYVAAVAAVTDTTTKNHKDVVAKDEARKALVKMVRGLAQQYLLHNPSVTNNDRTDLHLPIYKDTRTPAPVAHTRPTFKVDTSEYLRLTIHFFDPEGEGSKAKPAGQHGAEIRYGILDAPPINAEALTHSAFDTHTPFTLDFGEEERGKTVYFALRWENTRGQKGPWTLVTPAVIP
jgi:hypothetical protein